MKRESWEDRRGASRVYYSEFKHWGDTAKVRRFYESWDKSASFYYPSWNSITVSYKDDRRREVDLGR
jgi:hypothetical protein